MRTACVDRAIGAHAAILRSQTSHAIARSIAKLPAVLRARKTGTQRRMLGVARVARIARALFAVIQHIGVIGNLDNTAHSIAHPGFAVARRLRGQRRVERGIAFTAHTRIACAYGAIGIGTSALRGHIAFNAFAVPIADRTAGLRARRIQRRIRMHGHPIHTGVDGARIVVIGIAGHSARAIAARAIAAIAIR